MIRRMFLLQCGNQNDEFHMMVIVVVSIYINVLKRVTQTPWLFVFCQGCMYTGRYILHTRVADIYSIYIHTHIQHIARTGYKRWTREL